MTNITLMNAFKNYESYSGRWFAATIILNLVMKLSVEEVQQRFPSFEAELVQDIVKVSEIKSCNKGEYILRRGQYIRSVIIVFDGLVKVSKANGNGNYFFLHYIKGGQAFSLTMTYGPKQEPSEVIAVAFEKTILMAIPLSCMDKWMMEYKSWYQFVFDTIRNRIKDFLKIIDHIVFLNMNERLVYYLKLHEEMLHSKNIPVTKTEIAKEFSSSREVITRLLKQLASKGKIKTHRHYIEIIDL